MYFSTGWYNFVAWEVAEVFTPMYFILPHHYFSNKKKENGKRLKVSQPDMYKYTTHLPALAIQIKFDTFL